MMNWSVLNNFPCVISPNGKLLLTDFCFGLSSVLVLNKPCKCAFQAVVFEIHFKFSVSKILFFIKSVKKNSIKNQVVHRSLRFNKLDLVFICTTFKLILTTSRS